MKPLNITSQKTAVLGEKDSRNSLRPVLEQAGFTLDFDRYSRILGDSPDTTLADMRNLGKQKLAVLEIVQTGTSIERLGLFGTGDARLIRNVSTDIYADFGGLGIQQELFKYFIQKIQRALGEL